MSKITPRTALYAGVAVLALLIIVGFIGASQTSQEKESAKSTLTDNSTVTPETTEGEQRKDDTPELHIDEWGVKVGFPSADKVTYEVSEDSDGRESAAFILIESITGNPECQPVGAGLVRTKDTPPITDDTATKIGDYYYYFQGAPGPCVETDEADAAANKLKAQITSKELGEAIVSADE